MTDMITANNLISPIPRILPVLSAQQLHNFNTTLNKVATGHAIDPVEAKSFTDVFNTIKHAASSVVDAVGPTVGTIAQQVGPQLAQAGVEAVLGAMGGSKAYAPQVLRTLPAETQQSFGNILAKLQASAPRAAGAADKSMARPILDAIGVSPNVSADDALRNLTPDEQKSFWSTVGHIASTAAPIAGTVAAALL